MAGNRYQWLMVGLMGMVSVQGFAQEICNNGTDDNNNGLIDLADPQCACFDTAVTVTSYVPDPSFEDMIGCPDFHSQIDSLTYWKQGTATTTDYFNSCGYTMPGVLQAGLSATDGNGFVGAHFLVEWKEYFGTKLLTPFIPGKSYTLSMDVAMTGIELAGAGCLLPPDLSPVKVSVFGTADSIHFPLAGTQGCPTLQEADGQQDGSADWVFLGDVLYTPSSDWSTVHLSFMVPQPIEAIVIGPPCDLPPDYPASGSDPHLCFPYAVFDHIRVEESPYTPLPVAQIQIDNTGNCLGGDYVLTAGPAADAVYHWTTPGQGEVTGNPLVLNNLTEAQQGTYSMYYVTGSCSSVVNYALLAPQPANSTGMEPAGLFNIISPNGDGVNDYLSGEEMTGGCGDYELVILSRWGNEIFRQVNDGPPFAGENNYGNKVPAGVYFYTLRVGDEYYRQTLTVSY